MRRTSLLLALPLFFIACAQVGSPSGGPKDMVGPKVEFAAPDNYSVEFKGDRLLLEFDEFISNKGIANELIITPKLEQAPEIKITGKRLELIFEEGLTPNTTYTISFGKSVVDLSEQNPVDSNKWIFSTGTYLDSGKVSGQIKSSYEEVLEGEFWVFLYEGGEDSLPIANRPYCLNRANEKGEFELDYLRAGDYKIFALKDDNKNYNYDLPDEDIAFLSERVAIGNDSIILSAFKEDRALQYVVDASLQGEILNLNMKKASRGLQLSTLEGQDQFIKLKENRAQDSLKYWSPQTKNDSFKLVLNEANYSDTIELIREEKLPFSLNIPKEHVLGNSLKLKSNCPLSELAGFSLLRILEEDTQSFRSTFLNNFEQDLDGLFTENGNFSLKILPDTNSGETCKVSDTLSYSVNVLDPNELMFIELKIGVEYGWAELLDEKGRFLKKVSLENGRVKFEQLQAGNYKVRLVLDANQNGYWDTGDYLKGVQPEKVFYLEGGLELKKGFDLVQEWEVN